MLPRVPYHNRSPYNQVRYIHIITGYIISKCLERPFPHAMPTWRVHLKGGLWIAWQQSAVANSQYARRKLRSAYITFQRSAYITFQRCYWLANLKQTDNVANTMPEFRPVCNKPSTLPNTNFSKSPVILALTAPLSLSSPLPIKNVYYQASLFTQ
jgi:hypothetical protein